MRHSHDFEVDGTKYQTSHYPTGKAVRLLTKLGKIIGPSIGSLSQQGMDTQVSGSMIGDALQKLFENIEADESEALLKEILSGTLIFTDSGNRVIVFDTDFAGSIGRLFKVAKEILQFQYSDFLAGIAEITPATLANKTAGNRIKAV